MESLEWFWLNSIAIILAVSFINKYKERKGGVSTCSSIDTYSAAAVTEEVVADDDVTADNDDANTGADVQPRDSGGDQDMLASEVYNEDLKECEELDWVAQRLEEVVIAIEKTEISFLNLTEDKSQKEVSPVEIEETSALNLTEDQSEEEFCDAEISSLNLTIGQSQKEVIVVENSDISSSNLPERQSLKEFSDIEKAEISILNFTEIQSPKEANVVEKTDSISLNLTRDQSQNITSTYDIVTISSLKEMLANSNKEVWAFNVMNNQIYSAQITMTQGNILLKSFSKRTPPANTERIKYQTVKNLINRNNITTFLEINYGQGDNSHGSSVFIHIQLKGDEGRTKQFELMCTGEENGISYARTTFLETESSPLAAIWGGDRNDGYCGTIRGFTTGGEIIKTVTPGLVAGSFQRNPTHFVIYAKGNEDYKENYTIGKVVKGLNNIPDLYEHANLYGPKSINIVDCGIVLARTQMMSIPTLPSPITVEHLKDMVTQTTSGVWAVLKMNDRDYSAQIVNFKGYLLLKSLSKRSPTPNDLTIPYQEVKNLVNRDNITTFLKIKLSEKENEISENKFIHIKLFGNQGRHKQFEVLCTGEVNGISYAKTDFLGIIGFPAKAILGGERNDGLETELPGFTRGESGRTYITPGLVAGFYKSNTGRKPTHFLIYTEEASHDYQEISSIGKVVLGLNDIHMLYTYAKLNGSAYIKINDCGIVLD